MFTEKEITFAQMYILTNDGHVCARCGGKLTVCWGGAYRIKGFILRCGNNITHSGITRHDKEYENKNREVRMDSTALSTMKTGQMLARVTMAKFPQELTPADKRLLAQMAIDYGFDPAMGEITIYQGKPYVSIDGRYRKAQETGKLNGVETRPATKEEREQWQIPDKDYFFRADVHVKDAAFPFVGWGRVFAAETINGKGFKPIEKNPQRMAEKRAEAQALRKGFHIDLPSFEDIGAPVDDPGIIESTAKIVKESEMQAAARVIRGSGRTDSETGAGPQGR